MVYANKDRYKGTFINSKKQSARAEYFFNNGQVYEGAFQDDEINGKGRMTYTNGDVFVGNWADGLRSGKGIYTYFNGAVYDGFWENDLKCGKKFPFIL